MGTMNFSPAAESAAIKQVTAPAAATSNAAPATEQKEPQTNPTSRRRAPSAPIWSALTSQGGCSTTCRRPCRTPKQSGCA